MTDILLASCEGEPSDTKTTSTTDIVQDSTTVDTEIRPELPDVTFEGEEFRIMYRYNSHAYNIEDIWVEAQNGEVINDAVYERNLALEDKYKIKIVPLPETSPVSKLKTNVLAGDDFCEMLADRKLELFPATMENYTWNLNDLEYIDFDKPWWDTNAAEQLSVGNSLYMIGDCKSRKKQ